MKLKTAIFVVNSCYQLLLCGGIIGLALSFFVFKNWWLVIAIVISVTLVVTASFIKTKLINSYFKRCKYPYEFWSVLDKLDLTQDLKFDWGVNLNEELYKQQADTDQFLQHNKLSTRFVKSPNLFWPDVNNPVYIPNYVMIFETKGLSLNGESIAWNTIKNWYITGANGDRKGKMNIELTDDQGNSETITTDLDRIEIKSLDLLLLMAHFKIKNG